MDEKTMSPEGGPALEPPAPPPEAPAPISPAAALSGALIRPGETFRRIVEAPWTWVVFPLLVVAVLNVAASFAFTSRVDMRQLVRDQIQKSRFASQMSEEQIEEAAERAAARPRWITAAFGAVGFVVLVLFLAALFWLVLLAFGKEITFQRSLLAVGYAFLPAVVSSLLFLLVLFLKDPNALDVNNPLATNVAAFLDREQTAKPLYALLKALDLFKFWILYLLSLGLAAAARCQASSAAAAVGILYALWVGLSVTLAALF